MKRRATLLVVPAYAALALLYTWPLALDFRRAIPRGSWAVDALLQAFILGWDLRMLGAGLGRIFAAPIFHPEPAALTYMDHLIGEAALAAPVRALGGSDAAAYNTLVLLSFVLTGWAAYRLARVIGASRLGGFLGGFLIAFGPYRIGNLGNLNQLHTALLVLGVFLGVRHVVRGRAGDLALAFAALSLQAWFGWYGTFHLAVSLALLVAFAGAWGAEGPALRRWGLAVACGLAAAGAALPVARPYLLQARATPEFERTLGQAALYSADVLDYFRAGDWSRLASIWPAGASERAASVGVVTALLALLVLGRALRGRGPLQYLVALGATGFVLSLGPLLQVAGHRLPVPLPYAAFHLAVPGFASMRAPGRFAVLALIAAGALAALGWDALRRRLPGPAAALAFGVLLSLAAIETLPAPIARVELPREESLPAVYRWLREQPGAFAIVELPLPAAEAEEGERDARRQMYVLHHGKPSLDGVSGFSPRRQERFRHTMQAFPADSSLAAARARGARYVVVHGGETAPPPGVPAGLREVARFGPDRVYAFEDTGPR